MTKAELIKKVSENSNSTQVEAKRIIENTFSTIFDTLASGENVTIVGFGNFKVVERAARTGHNPQTGESLEIPAFHAVTFKPTSALKEAVKEL